MKNRKFELFLCLFVAVISAIAATAQSNLNDWSAVRSLPAGKRIFVETKAGETVVVKLLSADETSVTYRRSKRDVKLERDDISRVFFAARKSILKRAFWGAAAGGGIGIALGIGVGVATKSPLIGAGGLLIGFPAGAAIGAATTGQKRGKLIYSSP